MYKDLNKDILAHITVSAFEGFFLIFLFLL